MKRKTLKRKISIVGILVFVSMIVYSCWQDEWSSNVTDEVIFDSNKELTIAKAEQWYNATNPSATTVRSLSADGRIPAKPNWNKAKESIKLWKTLINLIQKKNMNYKMIWIKYIM